MTSSPSKIIGALLTDRATLLGMPVRIIWPDGPPPGWSEADLVELGERWWAPGDRPPTDPPADLERALLGPTLARSA